MKIGIHYPAGAQVVMVLIVVFVSGIVAQTSFANLRRFGSSRQQPEVRINQLS